MTSQIESSYENESKRFKNNFVETTYGFIVCRSLYYRNYIYEAFTKKK